MAQYDLTPKIGKYLDRHLIFPLLEFLEHKQLFPEKEILQGKSDLLQGLNMVDFEMDIYKKLHGTETVPPEMEARRNAVLKRLQELQEEAAPILNLVEDQQLVKQLRAEKLYTPQHLAAQYKITLDLVDALYRYAKFQFDCGNYSGAAAYLSHVISLTDITTNKNYIGALWGKLAGEILSGNWDEALEDLNRLRDHIAANKGFANPKEQLEQLEQRTWLIHWSLFVFFNHPTGKTAIVELFFQDKYLNAIQINSPHLLRYLTAAVITNKRRRHMIKDLVQVLQQESENYSDPITQFCQHLFIEYDFDAAQQKLRECEQVLGNDYFLVGCRDEFMENARVFVFETYCRIHQRIDLKMISSRLNMGQDEAEKWIVNLIRDAHLDAKIDAAQGYVIMGHQTPSVYEQIIERCKSLNYTQAMAAALKGARE